MATRSRRPSTLAPLIGSGPWKLAFCARGCDIGGQPARTCRASRPAKGCRATGHPVAESFGDAAMANALHPPASSEEIKRDPTLRRDMVDVWWHLLLIAKKREASCVEFRRPQSTCVRFLRGDLAGPDDSILQPPILIRRQLAQSALRLFTDNAAVYLWRRFVSSCSGRELSGEFELIDDGGQRTHWEIRYSESSILIRLLEEQ